MAWLAAVPLIPSLIDAIGRAVHGPGQGEDLSRYAREAQAELAKLQQEHKEQQERGERQNEALERRLEEMQQEREDVKKDLQEQPTGSFEILRAESREKYNLQENSRNLQLTGLTSTGKSYLGNVLSGIDVKSDNRFEMAYSECTQQPEARVSQRAELKGLIVHDCPGTGTESNEPRKAVKELKPAGFNMVLVVIGHAIQRADCAVITFCHAHKIPWAIVKSKMDLAILEAGSKEKVIPGVTANVKRSLGLRNILVPNDHLFFIDAEHFDAGNFDEKALVNRLRAIK